MRPMLSSVPLAQSSSERPAHSGSSVLAEVVFGQMTKKCVGAGICKIMLYRGRKRPPGCGSAIGVFSVEAAGLMLKFQKHRICPKVRDRLFSKPYFEMGEAFVLPEDLCTRLGIEALVIPKGKFLLLQEKGEFVILF